LRGEGILAGDGSCAWFADEVPAFAGCWAVPTGGVYGWPNSPGANDNVEQKPSEELIIKVKPSFDHVRSVNVAKCKLLTTHRGVCCCVSYTRTASCVATAYTILYGNEKTGLGLWPAEAPSFSAFLDAVLALDDSLAEGVDGGSIESLSGVGFVETAGSGRDAKDSSPEEVSSVI
jgi:hypothetical protein